MNLKNKKELAKKVLGIGKNRIIFSPEGLAEIKEAITKEDIKSLHAEGIISIKPIKGRRKIIKRKTRRGYGKIKMKVKNRKRDYVKLTRKLRAYLKDLKRRNEIDKKNYLDIRKKIKMRYFKSKSYLEDYIKNLKSDYSKTENKKATKSKKIGGKKK
jgi:large subunit ribosomal protein L19e